MTALEATTVPKFWPVPEKKPRKRDIQGSILTMLKEGDTSIETLTTTIGGSRTNVHRALVILRDRHEIYRVRYGIWALKGDTND